MRCCSPTPRSSGFWSYPLGPHGPCGVGGRNQSTQPSPLVGAKRWQPSAAAAGSARFAADCCRSALMGRCKWSCASDTAAAAWCCRASCGAPSPFGLPASRGVAWHVAKSEQTTIKSLKMPLIRRSHRLQSCKYACKPALHIPTIYRACALLGMEK